MDKIPLLRLGTSAFTAAGWEGTFYPAGMKPANFLSYYASKFDAVEVDSTFYRTPAISMVKGWYAKTPPGFLFAAKVPQVITHEKVLHDCDLRTRKEQQPMASAIRSQWSVRRKSRNCPNGFALLTAAPRNGWSHADAWGTGIIQDGISSHSPRAWRPSIIRSFSTAGLRQWQ